MRIRYRSAVRDCFSDISEISSLRRIYSDWCIDKDANNVVEESKAVNGRSTVSSALPESCGAGQNMLDLTCARADFCKKVKKFLKVKISRNFENTWGKLLHIV